MTEETTAQFYQPTDADGNPIGLPIEYDGTQKDLQEKLTAATQRMRFVVSREKFKALKAPDNAERFKEFDSSSIEEHRAQVEVAVKQFTKSTPSYCPVPFNFHAISEWIDDNNLDPTVPSTFTLAFTTLSRTGLLIDANGQPTTSDDPTGISHKLPDGTVLYGRKAVDAMSSEEYKRRFVSECGFKEKVERLYKRQAEQEKIA